MTDQKPKKIIFVITKSNWGGAQKYVYDLATSLPKELYDITVAFGGTGPLHEKLVEAGIKTHSIPTLGRDVNIAGDAQTLYSLTAFFLKEKPDIVHVNSSKVGGLGALAGRLTGVPRIIFTCHGWPFNEERGFISLSLIRFFSWLTVILSHQTIAVSMRDLIDGKRMFGANHKITLVHNGIRTPVFKETKEARKTLASYALEKGVVIEPEDFLVGAIGELHKNKGYEYMFRAFAQVIQKTSKNSRLVVMGEGEDRIKLEKLITELNLEKHVALLGFIPNSVSYLRGCNAFTLTSIKEGLPYVVIEAGFAGLPIVATNVGGVKEIIDDMQSGILVQTRKPDDIAQGLILLATDTEKALKFGAAIEQKVINEFSLEHMTRNTTDVYNR